MPTRSPRSDPSQAYKRFRASMIIDYGKWRDGEPYDIAALSEITLEERDLLTDEIIDKGSLIGATSRRCAPLVRPKPSSASPIPR